MDTKSERVLFSLVNGKRNSINRRIAEYISHSKIKYKRDTNLYLIFAESEERELPYTVYIGKTVNTIMTRYKQHLYSVRKCIDGSHKWSSKYRWMANVISNEVDLRVISLGKVPKGRAYEFEKEWITFFKDNDFNVINRDNNKYYEYNVFEI